MLADRPKTIAGKDSKVFLERRPSIPKVGEAEYMTQRRTGAHVYWTRPRAAGAPSLDALEQSILVASAVVWRKVCGPIVLFTDRVGQTELANIGLLPLWDHVDTEVLERIPREIHAPAFWDLAKTVVLAQMPLGAFVLDLDLIVWNPIPAENCSITFLHWEAPAMPWYPESGGLSVPAGYVFDRDFDWQAPVCNTALICSQRKDISGAFLAAALRFAQGNRPVGTGIAEMLFAGQRLLAHTARRHGALLTPVIDYLHVPCGESRWLANEQSVRDPLTLDACERGVPFTHLWRFKHTLRQQPAVAAKFRNKLLLRCRERAGEGVNRWQSLIGAGGEGCL